MTEISALIAHLRARGLEVFADGGSIVLRPSKLVTFTDVEAVRANKSDCLRYLLAEGSEGDCHVYWRLTEPEGRESLVVCGQPVTIEEMAGRYTGQEIVPLEYSPMQITMAEESAEYFWSMLTDRFKTEIQALKLRLRGSQNSSREKLAIAQRILALIDMDLETHNRTR